MVGKKRNRRQRHRIKMMMQKLCTCVRAEMKKPRRNYEKGANKRKLHIHAKT